MRLGPQFYPTLALMAVWAAFRLPETIMNKDSREQPAMFARQVSWWLMEEVCGWPHGLIAQFAQRDRSAVSHGVQTVLERLETDATLLDRVVKARVFFEKALKDNEAGQEAAA